MKHRVKYAGLAAALIMSIGTGALFIHCSTTPEKTYDKEYKIGNTGPAGGIIFYDKGNSKGGWRYLEAAPTDMAKAEWGCTYKSISGAENTEVGTGKSNTEAITDECGEAGIAAKLCAEYRGGGYSDWFLPSRDELDLIYKNLQNGMGGLNGLYWSSSQFDQIGACGQDFPSGYQECKLGKNAKAGVRPVRAF